MINIEKKLIRTEMQESKKQYGAVALYSGGVDSTLSPILAKNRLTANPNILLLMIDLGEAKPSLEKAIKSADILKMDLEIVDGKKEFADRYLSEAIRMNGSYWGYPLITPLSRAFMLERSFEFLENNGNSVYLIHGCTAKQNTRTRVEKFCTSKPNLKAIGPLTEVNLTRPEKIKMLEEYGIHQSDKGGGHVAEDENIWGRAIEGDILNDLDDIEKKNLFKMTKPLEETPNKPERVRYIFKNGVPVGMGSVGSEMRTVQTELSDIITFTGKLGAKHGLGRIVMFEDTVPEAGHKEVGLFESPASQILYAVHSYIEAAVFTKAEREVKRGLEQEWGEIVYRGGWFDTNRREISELVKPMHQKVNGIVEAKIFKGHILIGDATIPGNKIINQVNSAGTY